ncbi:MAG: type II secretion system protein [Phycisphaerae bacterium]|nr:type II secretion system protein [Phycisphaerae bacterium]
MSRKKAFTLIELLVVISIIALLVSILMPALAKARESAKATLCATQLKQFATSWYMYADDNNGFNIVYGNYVNDPKEFWFYKLAGYLGDKNYEQGTGDPLKGAMRIMQCPSTKEWSNKYGDGFGYGAYDMAWRWREETTTSGRVNSHQGGYTVNGWMQQRTGSANSKFIQKFDSAKGKVPLLSDGGWVDAWQEPAYATDADKFTDLEGRGIPGTGYRMHPNQLTRILLRRHSHAINIALNDNHVERVDLEKVYTFKWHNTFRMVSRIEGMPAK